jgi:hypothetical protein
MCTTSMYMPVTDDDTVMSRIVREVDGKLPATNEDLGLLGDRAIICPLTKAAIFLFLSSI